MAAKRPPNKVVTTPSGVEIAFYDEVGVDGKPQQRRYLYAGEKLVSISTVANVYEKPALPWWSAKTNTQGLLELADRGVSLAGLSLDQAMAVLREHGLDWQSVRDTAAKRGDVAHEALLKLLVDGEVSTGLEPEHRQYFRGGVRWVQDFGPEVIDAETIVASLEHKFAGRYDLFARITRAPAAFEHLIGLTGRIDYKTLTEWKYGKPRVDGSRDLLPPYPEHLSQTEGYEIGAVESGHEPSDFRAVVRLGPDGDYDMTVSWAKPEHFLGDLASYRNRQSINAAGAEKRKADRKAAVAA